MRVAIIGAGISGLALAYYLQKLGIKYDIFEASAEVGGLIHSVQKIAYQLELGPSFLQMTDELKELLEELKLQEEVVPAAASAQQSYLWQDKVFHPFPTNLQDAIQLPFLAEQTKQLLEQESLQQPKEVPYETVSQFFKRRFGQEVLDYIVRPKVSGFYGCDTDVLIMDKALPKIKELERTYGSVTQGLEKEQGVLNEPIFTLSKGLQSLPEAIASKLISLHLEHRVEMVHRSRGKYFLSITNDMEGLSDEEYDAVVVTLPAQPAAELLNYVAPGMAAALLNVNYSPMTVVHTVYRHLDVEQPLAGMGAFHSPKENLFSLGTLWTSSVFPHCSPRNEVLFTTLVGCHSNASQTQVSRTEVLQRVHEELKQQYSIAADAPIFQHYYSWSEAIPQADVFIQDVHDMAASLEQEQIYGCGNWLSGPAVSDCIKCAKNLAQKIYSQRSSIQ